MAVFDFSPSDMREAGWAIVFSRGESDAVKSALQPLIDHRRRQISQPDLVKQLDYYEGESPRDWLNRHKVDFGTVRPDRLPYYLLIVGSPEQIPFQFSQTLSLFYGVGRLHFNKVEEYARYVESLIRADTATSALTTKEVIFFGPKIKDDWATKIGAEILLRPLADQTGERHFFSRLAKVARVGYASTLISATDATKDRLLSIFRPASGQPPSLLFVTTHGLQWSDSNPEQRSSQGALICQDYPGTGVGGLKPEHYFAAQDLPPEAQVFGMTCFLFASYSVGFPDREILPDNTEEVMTAKPFFAALPQALLSHNRGGALGVIGLINRGWLPPRDSQEQKGDAKHNRWMHLQPYENAISNILRGWPLGYALREFNDRCVALSAQMANPTEFRAVSDRDQSSLWLERASLTGFTLFGDPAAKLNTSF